MRLLVVGDFHGKFPKKFEKLIKNKKIDLVLSVGDYLPFLYRDLWFKHCYKSQKELWEFIGKRKHKELVDRDLREAEKVFKKLNSLPVPVFTVLGNVDYPYPDDIIDLKDLKGKKTSLGWLSHERLLKILKKYKNIHRIDYSFRKYGGFVFIGARGHSVPGKVKSSGYRKHRKILERLFKKFRKENSEGKLVFITHNLPYKSGLDKVGIKAHKAVKGKNLGNKMFRRLIDKYQPVLHLAGHIHESSSKKRKLGKTLVVNPGEAGEGKAAIVELPEDSKKIKVNFIK
jgi:Icc-related predicted phosphoesterase